MERNRPSMAWNCSLEFWRGSSITASSRRDCKRCNASSCPTTCPVREQWLD
jgi:hypothetical protein